MSETDPLRVVLDRVLSRMHHSMKRLSYRLRSEDDSPEVREVLDEHLGEIAYESEVIAFYMAEYPPPVTRTEWGVDLGVEGSEPLKAVSQDAAIDTSAWMNSHLTDKLQSKTVPVTRQVTAWQPVNE